MLAIRQVTISNHTTSSTPHPHILYILQVELKNGTRYDILRRYSEFVQLQSILRDDYILPSKKTLTTTMVSSAWVDDELIIERKRGLAAYIDFLLGKPHFEEQSVFVKFLSPGSFSSEAIDTPLEMRFKNAATGPDRTFIAASYYPAWSSKENPPQEIKFSQFDIIFFAFVTPTGTSEIIWDSGSQEILKRLVSSSRASGEGTKIVLSVGGWGGSHWYSHAVSNDTNRKKLVSVLYGVVKNYGLDGIDVDWEYPNSPGSGNPHSSADAANLLSFLKLLRAALGPSKIISAAVTHQPWLGEDGKALSDVSAYAAQMTYVNIMNYDVFGASANPGPNAPLGNSCGTSSQPQANAEAALEQWTRAGMPPSKLLLGLATYGYVSKSKATKLSGSFAPSPDDTPFPPGAHPRDKGAKTFRTVPDAGDLSGMWGQQIAFHQLVRSGVLKRKLDGTYDGANGFTMSWDDCSHTPFLFNVSRSTVVTYDDTSSCTSKAKFAKQNKMAGCFTWSKVGGNYMAGISFACRLRNQTPQSAT